MVTIVAHPLLFAHSATCAIEPTPNVTRTQYSPALTGPVFVSLTRRPAFGAVLALRFCLWAPRH